MEFRNKKAKKVKKKHSDLGSFIPLLHFLEPVKNFIRGRALFR